MLYPAGRRIFDAPPDQEEERPESGQVDRDRREISGQGEPRGLPAPGGGGGDRTDPHRLPLPGDCHLCL